MIIRELIFYYRSNKFHTIWLIFQISAFFVLNGTFFAFTSELQYDKWNIENMYKNKDIYHLLDGYYEADKFSEFIAKPESLTLLKDYYNELNTAKCFQYLAMFNQEIKLDDEKLVKSFQMNKQASDYFQLVVKKGRTFCQSDFENNGAKIPILLGSDYSNEFRIGDTISADYYLFYPVSLEVVGIIQEDSFVYYNGDSEYYLDDSIIIPYINYGTPKTELDKNVQIMVYFAMVNGFVSIDSDKESVSDMMMEIEAISEKTGFYNYEFVGSNPNVQQYRGLINIVNRNYNLVSMLLLLSFGVNTVTIGFQLYAMQKKRMQAMAIHYLNGAKTRDIYKQFNLEVFMIIFSATIASGIILGCLNILDAKIIVITAFLATILMVCISFMPIYELINIELIQLLNREDDIR